MVGVCPSFWRPYSPLKPPHHMRRRTPLRQRIAAIAHAVAPMDKKIVPRTISTTSPRSVSRAASAVLMAFIERFRFVSLVVLSGKKSAMDKEYGNDRVTQRHDLIL